MKEPRPTTLHYGRASRELRLVFEDGVDGALSAEFLRVHSPSAEVRGHGPSEAVLQTGKSAVGIRELIPVGHYAVQIAFDDGHDSGIYSWAYLRQLLDDREPLWQRYIEALEQAGASRDPDIQVLTFQP